MTFKDYACVFKGDRVSLFFFCWGCDVTSSKWRPDDPADGLDPVVHVRLGVCHEQEGFMTDWRPVLLSCSTYRDKHEGGETKK